MLGRYKPGGGNAIVIGVLWIAIAIYASFLHGELSCIAISFIGFGLLCILWGIVLIKAGREVLQKPVKDGRDSKPQIEQREGEDS